ncbi:MAG: alpha/beta hydrolase [Pseudomonadota bacterium]|nr:alpha/beta hydrolase [Pseudomonadota bacterium]
MPRHPSPDSGKQVARESVTFSADDNVRLTGSWFQRVSAGFSPSAVTVMLCGAGVPARFYSGLAQYLAEQGAAVLTFDYRGIGESRHGSLRSVRSGMDAWAHQDVTAALRAARKRHPDLPMSAVAHSVGTLLIGASPEARELSRVVFLGAHTGYWGDYQGRWRVPLFLMWHVAMPLVTRVVGYFPGRALHLGEDLPRQVAMDWAARRQPQLIRTATDERRFGPTLHLYAGFVVPTLSLSASDDAFAPPRAAQRLLAMYPNLHAVAETVTPAAAGCRRLGHFGFFRSAAREHLWPRIAAWLGVDATGGAVPR